MKNVTELLTKRLDCLTNPFSHQWISDLLLLKNFVMENSETKKIIASIHEEKIKNHEPLLDKLAALFSEGKKVLNKIKSSINKKAEELHAQITEIQETVIDSRQISDPFFELESIYYKYYKGFTSILREIVQDEVNAFLEKYRFLGILTLNKDYLNITPSSLPFFQCQQEIEVLRSKRSSSIWGQWDLLLRWADWTKNGVSPTNEAHLRQLSYMFKEQKASEIAQSCGLYFLECLANKNESITSIQKSEVCIKALQLFLDQSDQYWIIVHFFGEGKERREFFIKKLQRERRPYNLLNMLLKAEPYTEIDLPNLPHTLGELEIKNELKKAFFPQDKFAGPLVHVNTVDCSFDVSAILNHLSSIQIKKKNRPSFELGYYIQFCSTSGFA